MWPTGHLVTSWRSGVKVATELGAPGGTRTPDPRIRSLSRVIRGGPVQWVFVLVRPDIDDEIAAFVSVCANPCGYVR
jgi:hypothetical protein